MLILAVDTTLTGCSCALVNNAQLVDVKINEQQNRQAETLISLINDLLEQNNFSYSDIDLIISTIGPGSFTGLRVGIAAMKGIALAIDKPTSGITSLGALSYKFSETNKKNKRNIISIIDARRQQLYIQKFTHDSQEITTARLINLTDIKNHISAEDIILCTCSDIAKTIGNHVQNASFTAADTALFTAEKLFKNIKLQKMTPLYIRQPDAEKPKKLFI